MLGEIILFGQNNLEAPARCIPGNGGAVNTAADDKEITIQVHRPCFHLVVVYPTFHLFGSK